MTATLSRQLGLRVLGRLRRDKAWLQSVLPAELEKTPLSQADRAFITRLLNGTLSYLGVLDQVIDRHASRPSKIEPRVRDSLRLAVYELLFMDTPTRAAVSEGVDLVRSVAPRATGMANAVLRAIDRNREEFPYGDPDTDIEALARLTGHPDWLARLFEADHGFDSARMMMHANNESAPLYLAHNPFLTDHESLVEGLTTAGAEPESTGVPGAIRCLNAVAAVKSPQVRDGLALVADLAAQTVVQASPYEGVAKICDVAAGRGTKTLLLQSHMARHSVDASIVAADLYQTKVAALTARLADLSVPRSESVVLDATNADEIASRCCSADLVFIDAPCSGLGTMRRHPEKRWSLLKQDIDALAALGSSMLEAASSVVRTGGFVVYSTCTVTRQENQDVVAAFIDSSKGRFSLEDLNGLVTGPMNEWVSEEGYFQSLPTIDGPDGHFAALMRRQD